jgi:formate dehydrogenase subunit gamma
MAITKAVRSGVVYRFNLAERIAHWNHALSFIVLLLTGAALVFRGLAALLGHDGLLVSGQIHRAAAVFFTVLTIPVLVIGARRPAGAWVRGAFRFDRDDLRFLALFPRDFFGLKVTLPDQGRFNAGEKINSIMQIVGWPVMVVTGWMLVFKGAFAPGLVQWVLAIHSVTAFVLGAAVIGHIYLASVHPHAHPGWTGMTSGWVPEWWARDHYRKWYDTLKQ